MTLPSRLSRKLAFLVLLMAGLAILVGAEGPAPAWARPSCSDCDSWPNLDYLNDPCARICVQ